MYCGKCGTQIPDDAAFCPVCGGKNIAAGAQNPQSGGQNPAGWNLNVQPDASHQQLPQQGPAYTPPPPPPPIYPQQPPVNNYSPVQTPDRGKNKKVLIIVISIIAVLLIVGIIATAMLIRRMRDDKSSDTTRRTRQTTTEALIASTETTESERTAQTTQETEPTTVETETTTEPTESTTEVTDTTPSDEIVPGLVPDYIWEFTDFEAELVDYAGHYQGYITTSVANLDQIYIFQEESRTETVNSIIESAQQMYFTDVFIDAASLEAYSEHPLSSEDGTFLYFDPFEILAGGYFEEYSNDNFDGTDVTMYGYVQTAFYQIPGGPPSFYLLNYEEYEYDGKTAYFEVRVDVEFIE
ncbi:MAG: zinc ribbon domain-containing protein [Clostridiaceae bacterium]|nr:zinc ribbon domain-containing protein [Clostridiaceae bacterium]